MIEELVKYWEEYKEEVSLHNKTQTTYLDKNLEDFMDYLSDKFKKDE